MRKEAESLESAPTARLPPLTLGDLRAASGSFAEDRSQRIQRPPIATPVENSMSELLGELRRPATPSLDAQRGRKSLRGSLYTAP